MKKINITIQPQAMELPRSIVFTYPHIELEDFGEVEIVPINSEGMKIFASEIRKVVRIGHPDENGLATFEASHHIKM